MKRRIYADLLDWKNRSDRKPLILEGVRQCGKTYILKEFGNREFDSLAYLDLERRKDLRPLFGDDLDPRRIITNIGIALGRRIVPGRTLIVLDEVQTCPRALTAMKYFCEEIPEQHVICAGSLLGILMAESESFPVGKVDRLKMYPMSFLEFMEACGEDSLCEMIRSIDPSKGLEETFRVRIEDCLRQYYVVGGLPDVVSSWVANHNESAVTRKLKNIERDYRDDFAKHAPELLPKLTAVWGSIPMQLGKENRKFMFAQVKGSGRGEDLSEALQWILNTGLAYRVFMVEGPSIPLKNVCSPSDFKVYLCDVGLMRVMSGRKASFVKSDAQEDRLYKGAMTENYVLCQMMSGGLEEAFYWKKGQNEVDFLIDGSDGAIPVEVKSEIPKRHASLDVYVERYHPETAFIVSMATGGGRAVKNIHLSCAELIPVYAGIAEVPTIPQRSDESPYVMSFTPSQWAGVEGAFTITVPRAVHRIGIPSIVQVFRTGSGGSTEVAVSKTITADGDVIIGSSQAFGGFVSII